MIRKNDVVQVIAGKEKGNTGRILSLDLCKGKVVVEKLNLVKKHLKANAASGQAGVVEKEAALHASNVLLFCPKCNRGRRHGIRIEKKGDSESRRRVCKKCSSVLDN